MHILEVQGLQKIYTTRFGGSKVEALKNVNFTVDSGEYVAIMGESGSGKTTLLNILAALDKPTAGQVILDGRDLSQIREGQIAAFRRDNLGFVFQEFNLLDTFTLEDNIFLPMVLAGKSHREMSQRLIPIARQLGISELLKKYPYEVSGGQKQRAAVARAIITPPAGAGGRAHRRPGLQGHRRAAPPLRRHQQGRAHHPHGHPLRQSRQPCRTGALHQGRRGVPPDLPGQLHQRAALPEDFGYADHAGDRR